MNPPPDPQTHAVAVRLAAYDLDPARPGYRVFLRAFPMLVFLPKQPSFRQLGESAWLHCN